MNHQRPYRSALVLWTSYFDPKYLAIKYFKRWITFLDVRIVLSIKKVINTYLKEILLFTTQLDLLTPEFFSELCISQRYKQKFERNWKNSVCIRISNFAKSANF